MAESEEHEFGNVLVFIGVVMIAVLLAAYVQKLIEANMGSE